MASVSSASREDPIGVFLHGLVLSVCVGVGLHTLSRVLEKKGRSVSYGWGLNALLFDKETNVEQRAGKSPREGSRSLAETVAETVQEGVIESMFPGQPVLRQAVHLLFCAFGLIVAFLIYGVQQERVMTSDYGGRPFRNPNFLILCNRFVAGCIAAAVCWRNGQMRAHVAAFKFSFCSISNILSSFCQFASLQFLTFPVLQVAKSCKPLAVLLVSYLVHRKIHPSFEYYIAAIVAIGAGSFFYTYATATKGSGEASNWPVGALFLGLFATLDGFTNVWQGTLFKKYKVTQWQMMMWVNVFSTLLTLLIQGTDSSLVDTVGRIMATPTLFRDVATLCASAVVGQLFIFHTIAVFGPLIFTLISIVRVILSILTSCAIYGHHIPSSGWACIACVFSAMGARAYLKWKHRLMAGRKGDLGMDTKKVIITNRR